MYFFLASPDPACVHAEFQKVVPYEGVCVNAHGFDVLADSAALVPHVLADVIRCAHGGAHNTEAVHLDYFKIGHKHGEEWPEGA